jgi:hypothetical protein
MAGANSSGWLTAGTLFVAGSFTATASASASSFVASSAHLTVFDGAGVQTVSFSNPGPSTQRFFDVSVANTTGSVQFNTNALVTGDLSTSGSTLARGGTAILEVRGNVDIDIATFDGLPLRIDSTLGTANYVLDGVTFTNMNTADTQLYIRVAGSGQITTNDMTFLTVPTTGLFASVASSNATNWTLQMQNPNPGNEAFTQTDGVANIVWPYP